MSEANLRELQKAGGHYIIGEKMQAGKLYERGRPNATGPTFWPNAFERQESTRTNCPNALARSIA